MATDDEIQDDLRGSLDVQARLLYGLIHACWIVTARGLQKMIEKYKRADFGRCSRVFCHLQPLLPVGLTDIPYEKSVKLYCVRCEDLYSPKSTRHGSIDGAYFGTTSLHLLFLVYLTLIPPKSGGPAAGPGVGGAGGVGEGVHGHGHGAPGQGGLRDADAGPGMRAAACQRAASTSAAATSMREEEVLVEGGGESMSTAGVALKAERYRPKIYGFQLSETARLQRWQEAVRDRQVARLELLEERA
ncbi:hypothetical protein H0H92_007291 [Tricholoma furcatifolium]|nr:hypothetical protein H0H92_007291 [Tricholoma furcatifolium]